MDSGNSGSLQSSSGGGDQEYDDSISRPNSMIYNPISLQSSMINPSFARYDNNNYNFVVPPVPSPSSMFNSPSEYLNMFSQPSLNQNQNSLMNQDASWSRADLQLDQPNYTASTLVNQNPLGSSSPMSSQNNQSINILASQAHLQSQPQGSAMLRRNNENGTSRIMKNSKKRTRASRRAPTTVLTTDTSNFRAMVQEFTGIPAPPFSTAPSTFSRRFDLFGSGSSSLFPSRPTPNNNNISSHLGSSNAAATASTNNTNLNKSNYEQVLNIPHRDPMLTFQSLLQPNASGFANQINYTTETTGFGTKPSKGGSSATMGARNGEQGVRIGNMNQQTTQEKGLEIMLNHHGSARSGGELGTVDSWIVQSD